MDLRLRPDGKVQCLRQERHLRPRDANWWISAVSLVQPTSGNRLRRKDAQQVRIARLNSTSLRRKKCGGALLKAHVDALRHVLKQDTSMRGDGGATTNFGFVWDAALCPQPPPAHLQQCIPASTIQRESFPRRADVQGQDARQLRGRADVGLFAHLVKIIFGQ